MESPLGGFFFLLWQFKALFLSLLFHLKGNNFMKDKMKMTLRKVILNDLYFSSQLIPIKFFFFFNNPQIKPSKYDIKVMFWGRWKMEKGLRI